MGKVVFIRPKHKGIQSTALSCLTLNEAFIAGHCKMFKLLCM